MKSRAAMIWETTEDDVDFADGLFTRISDSEQQLTFKEISRRLMETGGPLVGKGTVTPRGVGAGLRPPYRGRGGGH